MASGRRTERRRREREKRDMEEGPALVGFGLDCLGNVAITDIGWNWRLLWRMVMMMCTEVGEIK